MENNQLLSQILKNYEEIKKLEYDNKKLKELILKEKDSTILKNKVDDLLRLIDEKDRKFIALQERIKSDYGKIISALTKKLEEERTKNNRIPVFLSQIEALKQENKNIRTLQLKTQFLIKKDFEKKLLEVHNNYKINTEKHKIVLKDFEELKVENKKNVEIEKQRNIALIEKIKNLNLLASKIEEENKNLREVNNKYARQIAVLERSTIANKQILELKISEIKQKAEEKVKNIAKEFLDKEIEYKTRIDSLNKDLGRYVYEIKNVKEKYYNKEKMLKDRLREFL